MEYRDYLTNLESRFERYFDIEKNVNILSKDIELFAKYRNVNISTFITKNDVVDSYENNEFCFLKKYDSLSPKEVDSFTDFLKAAAENYVKPSRNHMSSYITGVILLNGELTGEIERLIKNFKHSKVYMFYLKGWCDIRLVLVELKSGQVITNRAASRVKRVYQITPFNKNKEVL